MDRTWPVYMEIEKQAIKYNIKKIQEYIGSGVQVMPIIKDCGYGTGLDDEIELLNECNINIAGVAIVDEGVKLRHSGFNKEIFVLNQIYKQDIESVINYDISLGIGDIGFLKELGKYTNHNFKVHIEVDTGMGRTGIPFSRVEEYILEAKKYSNLILEGIYTHFSCSDSDEQFTKLQIEDFNKALDICKKHNIALKYIHACNSAGVIHYKEAHFNLVRPGLILYGYYPDNESKEKLELKPAIKLKSKISFIKDVPALTPISYSKRYVTKKDTKIATVQLGYADGLRRSMTNVGKVVINGKVARMVGTICMDCFMIDVTDIPNVSVGDEVYIWDNESITVDDVADIYGTISYEVISTISNRVVRRFI